MKCRVKGIKTLVRISRCIPKNIQQQEDMTHINKRLARAI